MLSTRQMAALRALQYNGEMLKTNKLWEEIFPNEFYITRNHNGGHQKRVPTNTALSLIRNELVTNTEDSGYHWITKSGQEAIKYQEKSKQKLIDKAFEITCKTTFEPKQKACYLVYIDTNDESREINEGFETYCEDCIDKEVTKLEAEIKNGERDKPEDFDHIDYLVDDNAIAGDFQRCDNPKCCELIRTRHSFNEPEFENWLEDANWDWAITDQEALWQLSEILEAYLDIEDQDERVMVEKIAKLIIEYSKG